MTDLIEIMKRNSETIADNCFIRYMGNSITYADFVSYTNSVAEQFFGVGIVSGDVIAIISENIPQFIICQYATWMNNCVFLPLSPMDSTEEIKYKIRESNVSILIISSEFSDKFKGIEESDQLTILYTDPETFGLFPESIKAIFPETVHTQAEQLDLRKKSSFGNEISGDSIVRLLVYTSGTTGNQKAAMIRQSNIQAATTIYEKWFNVTSADINLGVSPFFHITGLIFGIALSSLCGSTLVLPYRFSPKETHSLIKNERTTITMYVATAYRAMLNEWSALPNIKSDLKSMRLWSAGGMPMSVKTEMDWNRLTGKWIHMAYGLTETTSPVTLWDYPYKGPIKIHGAIVSSGKPVYQTVLTLRSLENVSSFNHKKTGELIVSGPQVIDSYQGYKLNLDETFTENGFRTGDIAFIDKAGWVYIIDRLKNIINSSGYKIWPVEVENLIRQVSSVEDVIVIGREDSFRGEIPIAYVKLKKNESLIKDTVKDEILGICRQRLSSFKIPREIHFIDSIPLSPSGKINRRDVVKLLKEVKE